MFLFYRFHSSWPLSPDESGMGLGTVDVGGTVGSTRLCQSLIHWVAVQEFNLNYHNMGM